MECCYGWCHGTFGRARSSAAAVSLRHGASGLRYRVAAWPKSIRRRRTMHRTDTLDCFVVVRGEIYLVSDTDEVLLRAGDTAVVQGVTHAWSNRSNGTRPGAAGRRSESPRRAPPGAPASRQ